MKKIDYEKKLNYSCRDEESQNWDVTAPAPPKIMFELTNECNHRCIFCANREMKRETGFLNFDVFKKIARQARDAKVDEVALYTTGESLLHERIVDFVKESKDLGFSYIYLSSNGVLLTPSLSDALLKAGLDSLRISINAGTRESYKRIHGSDDFDTVISNLKEFDAARKRLSSDCLLSIGCVLTALIEDEQKSIEDTLGGFVDAIKITKVRVQGGNLHNMIDKIKTDEVDPRYKLKPCGLLWNGMHVDYEGNMTICCADFNSEMIIGDIKKDGLMNCWNGEKMKRWRKLHLEKKINKGSLCYICLTGKVN